MPKRFTFHPPTPPESGIAPKAIGKDLKAMTYRLALDKEGRTAVSAQRSATFWQTVKEYKVGKETWISRIRVFVDLVNPVTPDNTRAIMQTDNYLKKDNYQDEWLGNVINDITIGAAWHWCQDNADLILEQRPIGERWNHWDCLKSGVIPTEPVSMAAKIGCQYPIAKAANCF